MWLLEQQCTFWALGLWCCCIHRAVLNRRRKERAKKKKKKDAGEILWCAFSLPLSISLSLSLSLTGKASDISRQKTNSVSPVKSSVKAAQVFSLSLSLFASFSASLSRCLCFISVDAELWRPLTRFSNNNSSPPPPNCKFPLCQNPTHANTSFREPWTDNKR